MTERSLTSARPDHSSKTPLRRRRRALRPAAPQLSIVIVNYRQWESTAALVRQILRHRLARQGMVEVVVVDNHSPPHALATRLRRWPGVSLRRWGANRGFGRAVNEGCRLSSGRWLLLLNPDMDLPADFLAGALATAEEVENSPSAGIIGFQLLNQDGSGQLSAGRLPTLWGTLTGLLRPRARRKYDRPAADRRSKVAWVSGCCLLVRRDCLRQLGGLDESFFLYYEDVDLCRRAAAQGWSILFEPSVSAIHQRPIHKRTVPPRLRLITRHSLLNYARAHWRRWQFGVLAGVVRAEAWARSLWQHWAGDIEGANCFKEMGRLARDLWRGDTRLARRRLESVLQTGDPREPDGTSACA